MDKNNLETTKENNDKVEEENDEVEKDTEIEEDDDDEIEEEDDEIEKNNSNLLTLENNEIQEKNTLPENKTKLVDIIDKELRSNSLTPKQANNRIKFIKSNPDTISKIVDVNTNVDTYINNYEKTSQQNPQTPQQTKNYSSNLTIPPQVLKLINDFKKSYNDHQEKQKEVDKNISQQILTRLNNLEENISSDKKNNSINITVNGTPTKDEIEIPKPIENETNAFASFTKGILIIGSTLVFGMGTIKLYKKIKEQIEIDRKENKELIQIPQYQTRPQQPKIVKRSEDDNYYIRNDKRILEQKAVDQIIASQMSTLY